MAQGMFVFALLVGLAVVAGACSQDQRSINSVSVDLADEPPADTPVTPLVIERVGSTSSAVASTSTPEVASNETAVSESASPETETPVTVDTTIVIRLEQDPSGVTHTVTSRKPTETLATDEG